MANANFDQTLEGNLPVVNNSGLNTNKNANFGSTSTVTFNGGRVGAVNASSGNTSPTAAQSGQVFLFDSSTGITYTLPAPVVGAEYTFVVTTTVASGNHKVITDAGTTLLLGAVLVGSPGVAAIMTQGNGTTHIAVTMNGSTTGGLVGTQLNFKCVTATKWEVSGSAVASGTPATPFATS